MQSESIAMNYAPGRLLNAKGKGKVRHLSLVYKATRNNTFMFRAFRNIFVILALLIVPFSLAIKSRDILFTRIQGVIPVVRDIIKVRSIPIEMSAALNSAMLFTFKRDSIVRNRPVSELVYEDIRTMERTVEVSDGQFLPQSKEFIYGDLCEIMNRELNYNRCARYLKEAMKRGYSGAVA
jgi:hypothetical protein